MKIVKRSEAIRIKKQEGIKVDYFLFDEYEIHYNEQAAYSQQAWHRHAKIWETMYIIEGELTAQWEEKGRLQKRIIKKGDLAETQRSRHAFKNHTSRTAKFLIIKQILAHKNKRSILKTDKIVS